jgi:ATP-dependent Lon protease
MTKLLPLFPLELVVFPGEILNLHIFEPRYKQMIEECVRDKTTFGIPPYVNDRLPGFGTVMQIMKLVNRYEDGKLDIVTKGISVFKITEFYRTAPGKLYSAGETESIEIIHDADAETKNEMILKLHQLVKIAGIESPIQLEPNEINSYAVGHKIGLSLEQEYTLLTFARESERQDFIIAHLERVIPLVSEYEKMKEKAKQNGHFKNLPPVNL